MTTLLIALGSSLVISILFKNIKHSFLKAFIASLCALFLYTKFYSNKTNIVDAKTKETLSLISKKIDNNKVLSGPKKVSDNIITKGNTVIDTSTKEIKEFLKTTPLQITRTLSPVIQNLSSFNSNMKEVATNLISKVGFKKETLLKKEIKPKSTITGIIKNPITTSTITSGNQKLILNSSYHQIKKETPRDVLFTNQV